MAERKAGKREIQGEESPIMRRIQSSADPCDFGARTRVGGIKQMLRKALPADASLDSDLFGLGPDVFAPTPAQLHEMLDVALACQAHGNSLLELDAWRLVGAIILEHAFGGLRDAALWQARIRAGDCSAAATRRHLLQILRGTPHLIPKDRRDALATAFIQLEQGMEAPTLFQPGHPDAKGQVRSSAVFDIAFAIERHSTSKDMRRQLVSAAAGRTGATEETVIGWVKACRASDRRAMSLARAMAKQEAQKKTDKTEPNGSGGGAHGRSNPPCDDVLRLLDEAASKWRLAGGSPRAGRG